MTDPTPPANTKTTEKIDRVDSYVMQALSHATRTHDEIAEAQAIARTTLVDIDPIRQRLLELHVSSRDLRRNLENLRLHVQGASSAEKLSDLKGPSHLLNRS